MSSCDDVEKKASSQPGYNITIHSFIHSLLNPMNSHLESIQCELQRNRAGYHFYMGEIEMEGQCCGQGHTGSQGKGTKQDQIKINVHTREENCKAPFEQNSRRVKEIRHQYAQVKHLSFLG